MNPWLGASGRHRPCCNVSDPIEKIKNKYLSEKLHFRIFCWRLTELALVLARCIADNEVLSFHPPPECRDNNQPSTEYSQMQFFWKVLIYTNSNYPAFGHCSQKILNVFLRAVHSGLEIERSLPTAWVYYCALVCLSSFQRGNNNRAPTAIPQTMFFLLQLFGSFFTTLCWSHCIKS